MGVSPASARLTPMREGQNARLHGLITLFHYTCAHELDAEEEERSLPTVSRGARRRPCRTGWPVAVDRRGAAFWHGRALCRDGRGICLWRSHGALVHAGGQKIGRASCREIVGQYG